MDGYVAEEVQKEGTVALTLYFPKGGKPFATGAISALEFVGIEDKIEVSNFYVDINEQGSTCTKYDSYGIILTYHCLAHGTFETDQIALHFYNGTEAKYKIGNWVFDVGEKGADIVDAFGSPAVTSNGSQFDYTYDLADKDAKILKLWVGNAAPETSDAGLPASGTVELESNAPVKYIKAKIEVQKEGQTLIAYAKGCYCGACGFDDNTFETFREYSIGSDKG
jgi:hypothetical protein